MTTDNVILGGGCFWCLEACFQQVEGVVAVQSGYSGGTAEDANYKTVCSGKTEHAEVVSISWDSKHKNLNLAKILRLFFSIHNPTTLNQQGADRGRQYRSIIFYRDQEQYGVAQQIITEQQAYFTDSIVTELQPLKEFYLAENYHQNYYQNHQNANYSQCVIAPKVVKMKQQFN